MKKTKLETDRRDHIKENHNPTPKVGRNVTLETEVGHRAPRRGCCTQAECHSAHHETSAIPKMTTFDQRVVENIPKTTQENKYSGL